MNRGDPAGSEFGEAGADAFVEWECDVYIPHPIAAMRRQHELAAGELVWKIGIAGWRGAGAFVEKARASRSVLTVSGEGNVGDEDERFPGPLLGLVTLDEALQHGECHLRRPGSIRSFAQPQRVRFRSASLFR